MYAATCPLAVGQNIMLEKGIWWTIYDKTNFCGKKVTSTHLARERVDAQHRRLVEAQKPKFEPAPEYMGKLIAKLKADIAEQREREEKEKAEKRKRRRKRRKRSKSQKVVEKVEEEKVEEEKPVE